MGLIITHTHTHTQYSKSGKRGGLLKKGCSNKRSRTLLTEYIEQRREEVREIIKIRWAGGECFKGREQSASLKAI